MGTNSKGLSADVRKCILELWKDLLTSGIQGNVVILNNNVKMCCTCFNDYDKFAIKQPDLKQRLQVALQTLNLSQLSEQDSAINDEPSVITRKRLSGDGHPAAQKQMVEWRPSSVTTGVSIQIRTIYYRVSPYFRSHHWNALNWLAHKSCTGTTKESQCHQTILQPALIIGTSISGWRVNWSGYARLTQGMF